MKLSDVITLIGAGYTKEEIEALDLMERGASLNAPEVNTVTDAPKPEAPKPEDPKPEAKPAQDNSELLTAITGLTKALQVSNIRNTPQPAGVADKDIEAKADKALMEIYNL